MIVADDPRRQRVSLVVDDVDLVGFDDQIADRQDQPLVVDDDAGSLAIGAQRVGRCARRAGRGSAP